jgi:hypothetical protein
MGPKPREYDDDDGRTIVSMDIEGMRWHDRRVRREEREKRKAARAQGDTLTKSEARRFTWYSLLAVGLIGLVFSLTWVLFVLFCIYVWFR